MKKILLLLMASFFWMPALFANEVYFYFQDGEEDDWEIDAPQAYVSIWNNTVEEAVQVPEDVAFMSYNFSEATTLKIYPSDFDFELVVSVDGDLDTYILDKEENEWYLTLLPDADGLEIFVKVYLAGQAPGGNNISEVNLGFNINAATDSDISNPGELIGIEYYDRITFSETTVDIVDNYGSAVVVPGTSFTISPEEGYVISEISTYIEGVASISEPGSDGPQWYISVSENPSDSFASFFITIDKLKEEPGEDQPVNYAVVTQIEPLQWVVKWTNYQSISALDSEFDKNYATLTDASGKSTTLHANLHGNENPTVIFPEYGNYFTLNLESLDLAEGAYVLNIPEGYVSLIETGTSREPNPAQQVGINIGENPEVSFTPQISALAGNYFDISWENVTSLSPGNTTGAYMVNMFTDERYDLYYLEDFNYSSANLRIVDDKLRINITNNYPDLPSGSYLFYLPADYVKFNGTSTGNSEIEDHLFQYVKPWSEGEIEFNGPSDDNLITLTWVDASAIEYDVDYAGDGQKIKGITIYDREDNQIDVSYSDNISISGNVMTINLNGLEIVPGNCHLLIPEDCLWVTVNGETDYTYGASFNFIYGDYEDEPITPRYGPATWNIKPNDTVKGGTLVEINWKNALLTMLPDVEKASIHNFETGVLYLEYGTEVYLSEDKTKLLLDLSNMPSGIFRVNVPEMCVSFTINDTYYVNEATSMDDVIIDNNAGVDGIQADENGKFRVINVNGVVVLETENVTDINGLEKGIYIVNGNKIVK